MKGISPLIAAVVLIAFTTAIAGIMATWATSFVRGETQGVGQEADCIGALDISSPSFNQGNITITVKNTHNKMDLEGLVASVVYSDATKNTQYDLSDYGVADPFGPLKTDWAIINTGDTTKPIEIEITSATCPKQPASLSIP